MSFLSNDSHLKIYRQKLRKKQTDAEMKLWSCLRNRRFNGLKFYRQYSLENYIMDFYCSEKLLAIELDGSQHLLKKHDDDQRTKFLNEYGIHVMRF